LAAVYSPAHPCGAGFENAGTWARCGRTVQNLQVVEVREAENILLIKGAIPGAKGDYVIIRESKKIPKLAAAAKKVTA